MISLLIFSCGESKEKQKQTGLEVKEVNIDEKDDILRVYFTIKTSEDDKFQLLFIDDTSEGKYDAKKRLQQAAKGQDELQTLKFEFPKKVLPYKFRIDLGEKGYETVLNIHKIRLELNDNEIEIDSSTMDRYFQKNLYIETEDWLNFKRNKVSGKYDPFLTSKAFLIKKIEMEL